MLRDFDQPVVVEETVDDTYVNDPFVDEAGRDRRIDFVPYRMREELAARVSTVDRPGMTSGGLTGSPVTSVIFGLFGLSSFFFTGRWFFFFFQVGPWRGSVYVMFMARHWIGSAEGVLPFTVVLYLHLNILFYVFL